MSTEMIDITVNGDPQSVPPGQTVLELLASLQIDPARVAIEYNRAILKQPRWGEQQIEPGAQIEIVQFVGGG